MFRVSGEIRVKGAVILLSQGYVSLRPVRLCEAVKTEPYGENTRETKLCNKPIIKRTLLNEHHSWFILLSFIKWTPCYH
jgi:hypothetical protein